MANAMTSRKIVREGIATFFGGAYDEPSRSHRSSPIASSGLSVVRAYRDKVKKDVDFMATQAAGSGMGAYMTIGLGDEMEIRRAIPAVTGRKRITYQTRLNVYHMAREDFAEDAEKAVDDLVEAIKGLIHTDPTLGGVAFEAGENPTGIHTHIDPSVPHEQRTETFFYLDFDTLVEIIA